MARTAKRYRDIEARQWNSSLVRPSFFVGIYCRLSVDHNERKSESVKSQIEIARQFIDGNNKNPNRVMDLMVIDNYVDLGQSGTTYDRPEFERLMRDICAHKVTCLIVKDFSRLGRDYLETGNYIEKILPFMGVRFISIADGYDSMSEKAADDRMAMHLKNLVNEMYARDISKRVTIARRMNAEKGGFNGSQAPYGYAVFHTGDRRTLKKEEEPAQIVAWMFRQYADGVTVKEICEILLQRKVHRSSDYHKYKHVYCMEPEVLHQWNADVVKGLFKNLAYIGHLVQGKNTEKQIMKEDTHEPIISKEIYKIVQERIENESRNKKALHSPEDKTKVKEYDGIYRNIIFCGDCNRKLKAVYYQTKRIRKREYKYYCKAYYYQDFRKCSKKYLSEESLTRILKEILRILLIKGETGEPFNRQFVEDLVEKISLYGNGTVEINFKFRGGDFVEKYKNAGRILSPVS